MIIMTPFPKTASGTVHGDRIALDHSSRITGPVSPIAGCGTEPGDSESGSS
jgi:hypothetical protein